MYKEFLHSRVSLASPPEGEKAIIQQKQVLRSELKIQCVQMCQEHRRKYHKQELQNIMLPRCSLQGLGVRRGSWHPHQREKGPRAPCLSAGLCVTQSAGPFQWQSVRFWW